MTNAIIAQLVSLAVAAAFGRATKEDTCRP